MSKTDSKPLNYMVRDDNNESVQAGSSFTTADATATPVTSPLTVTDTIATIVVPDRAVEVIFSVSGADLRISEASDMSSYYVIPDGAAEAMSCALMQNIYVKRDAGTNVTLNFRFNLV